jgi:hypothetical protein
LQGLLVVVEEKLACKKYMSSGTSIAERCTKFRIFILVPLLEMQIDKL